MVTQRVLRANRVASMQVALSDMHSEQDAAADAADVAAAAAAAASRSHPSSSASGCAGGDGDGSTATNNALVGEVRIMLRRMDKRSVRGGGGGGGGGGGSHAGSSDGRPATGGSSRPPPPPHRRAPQPPQPPQAAAAGSQPQPQPRSRADRTMRGMVRGRMVEASCDRQHFRLFQRHIAACRDARRQAAGTPPPPSPPPPRGRREASFSAGHTARWVRARQKRLLATLTRHNAKAATVAEAPLCDPLTWRGVPRYVRWACLVVAAKALGSLAKVIRRKWAAERVRATVRKVREGTKRLAVLSAGAAAFSHRTLEDAGGGGMKTPPAQRQHVTMSQ